MRMRLYHVAVHSLAQLVLDHLRRQQLLRAGDRVGVAVSGGIDSVALLRLLLEVRGELGIVLSVVHFNHKLREGESDLDQQFVEGLARAHDLEFYCDGDDVAGHARDEGVSLETAARELRYGFFRHLIREGDSEGLKASLSGSAFCGPEGPVFHDRSNSVTGDSQTEVKNPTLSRKTREGRGTRIKALTPARLEKIVTGHTLDDQAETVLMRVIRGAGLRGLGGIYPRIAVEDDEGEACGEIVRPLLAFRRCELEEYLRAIGQDWREDATNADPSLTRNRVRKLVLPLLEKEFNPAVAENLAELAEIARGEEDYWENEAAGWMGTGIHWSEPAWVPNADARAGLVQIVTHVKAPTSRAEGAREMGHPEPELLQAKIDNARWAVMNASVDRLWFLGEQVAVQRRVVKTIGEHAGIPLEFKHVEEILRFAGEELTSGKELSLPLGWKVISKLDEIVFLTPDLRDPVSVHDYEYDLPIPGRVDVCEGGSTIEVRCVPAGRQAGYNPEHLLDAGSLLQTLKVRNWRAGDRFWPKHSKSPKKVKELLQERHVEQPQRKLWPVVVSGEEIIWMRGFPPSARFAAKPGCEAVAILEVPLSERESK